MSPTVLLVDDEPDIINTTVLGLRNVGFNVHSFTDPRDAVRHIEVEDCKDCSVVVSDAKMPQMNGFQLELKLKELQLKIKVIIMTAYEIDKRELEMLFPSMSTVENIIKKPFAPSKLADMIKEM